MSNPVWLPDMFPVNPWETNTFDSLYTIFRAGFIDNPANYNGFNIWFFPEKDRGKELIFWHLTEREDPPESGNRFPDFRRSERLPWARPILDNLTDNEILHWDYEEGDKTIKTYVWLKNYDYLIVMKRMPDGGRRLVTAFYVEYSNAKRKLQKKYDGKL